MKLSTYAAVIPIGAITGWLAVANRQAVRFSLDPFSSSAPAVAVDMPLYLLVFVTFVAGVLVGGAVVTINRSLRRNAAIRSAQAQSGQTTTLFFRRTGPKTPPR